MIEIKPCRREDEHSCNACIRGTATYDFRIGQRLVVSLCDMCITKLENGLVLLRRAKKALVE